MATKKAGGRITGAIALTVEASVALQEGDYVMVTDDYTVGLADASKPVIGFVSVRNVKRVLSDTASTFPVGNPGGDVTVEAHGFNVHTRVAAEAIEAGNYVEVDATGALTDGGAVATVATVGIALTGATAAGQAVDVLGR